MELQESTITTPPLLPTIYYPYYDRPNWKYCYQLSNRTWVVKERVSLPYIIQMASFCKLFDVPFRARPMGKDFNWHGACFLLNLFSIRLTDRKGEK